MKGRGREKTDGSGGRILGYRKFRLHKRDSWSKTMCDGLITREKGSLLTRTKVTSLLCLLFPLSRLRMDLCYWTNTQPLHKAIIKVKMRVCSVKVYPFPSMG